MRVCALICVIVWWLSLFPALVLRRSTPFASQNLHAGFSWVGNRVYRAHCSVVFIRCQSARGFLGESDPLPMICLQCCQARSKRDWTWGQWQCCISTAGSQYKYDAPRPPRGPLVSSLQGLHDDQGRRSCDWARGRKSSLMGMDMRPGAKSSARARESWRCGGSYQGVCNGIGIVGPRIVHNALMQMDVDFQEGRAQEFVSLWCVVFCSRNKPGSL